MHISLRSINTARSQLHATLFAGQGSGDPVLIHPSVAEGINAASLAPYNTGVVIIINNTNTTQLLDTFSGEQLSDDPIGLGGAPKPNTGTPCVGTDATVPGVDNNINNINNNTAGGQHQQSHINNHVSVSTTMPAILATQLGTYAAAGGPSLSPFSVAATGHSQGLMAAMLASAAGQSRMALQLLTGCALSHSLVNPAAVSDSNATIVCCAEWVWRRLQPWAPTPLHCPSVTAPWRPGWPWSPTCRWETRRRLWRSTTRP